MTITKDQAKEMGFDTWLRDVYLWPEAIPTDCTLLDADEQDCLQRNDAEPCLSCREYSKACEDYNNDVEGNNQ